MLDVRLPSRATYIKFHLIFFTKVGHAVADYALMCLKYPLMCLNFPNPDNHVSRQVALT